MREHHAVIVIPCFNEAARLDDEALLTLLAPEGVELLLVDDGSTDDTRARLHALAARAPKRIGVLELESNGGKGEAVRRGLEAALLDGALRVGYLDADLSTPTAEMLRILHVLEERPDVDVVLGSRVRLLGRRIERRALRHYLGRAFATAASLSLGLPVYDTQCGAKAFRRTPALLSALRAPFASRWVFDVELLRRLLDGDDDVPGLPPQAFVELPLKEWREVHGGNLGPIAMAKAGVDLALLTVRERARGTRLGHARRRS
ncbi:MAG: glycosyltransferase [Deltaproteobacteria bacterium]|nr:glycosyltransferase [Deltaproteobacteria bacterium]